MKRLFRPQLKRQDKIPQTLSSTDFQKVLLEEGTEIGTPGVTAEFTKISETQVVFDGSEEAKEAVEEPPAIHGSVCLIQESPFRIHKLATNGQLKAFIKLYHEQPGKLKVRDPKGKLPIHLAAAKNHVNIVDFIAQNSNDLDMRDLEGQSALHVAVRHDALDVVRALLAHGADPNLLSNRQLAPLHIAADSDRHHIIKALCSDRRTDVNIKGPHGATALHFTCYEDHINSAKVLIEHDAKICVACNVGLFPLHLAAQSGAFRVLEAIIHVATTKYQKKGVDVLCFKTQDNSSPIHAAVNGGMIEIVRICLQSGIAITTQMEDGSTPVHLAASQGSLDILRLMLDMQPNLKWDVIALADARGNTPLHKAALYDRADVIEYLVDEGADKDVRNLDEQTPVLLAASKRAWNGVSALLAKQVSIDYKDKENRNILHLIIQNGGRPDQVNLQICCKGLKQLLDEADNNGCTPLHYASKQGMISTIHELLELGAVLDAKNNQKQSPLHFAAQYGRYNTCLKLLESTSAGPKAINEIDGNGHSPLHCAAGGGHVKVVRLLLARGATCTRDIEGNTALHLAARSGYTQTMRLLLNTNTHLLDNGNKAGDTAIHVAADAGNAQAVTLLMTLGARFVQNIKGLTFLDLAIKNDHKDVCIAIISHDRWEDVVSMGSRLYGCPVVGFIKFMPEVCQMVLDRCRQTVGSPKCPDFHTVYNFKYLQLPNRLLHDNMKKPDCEYMPLNNVNYIFRFDYLMHPDERRREKCASIKPFHALSNMVRYNRVECLSHPVCIAYLNMKWYAYGMWLHMINLLIYVIFLASLTTFVSIYDFGKTSRRYASQLNESWDDPLEDDGLKLSSGQTLLVYIIMAFAVLNCVKELAQIFQQKLKYLGDASNLLEWILYVSTMIFTAPFLAGSSSSIQWQFGAVAVFLAWYNLLLFLRRFDFFGIYVVMFLEILKTLVSVLVVFSVLIVAFGMAFYILLQHEDSAVGHHNPWLSVTSTVVMMMGSVEYIDNWVRPYLENTHSYPVLSFLMLITFILFMPILLINLMIGLAVGDIEAIQRDARLKRLAMQVEIHTDWERNLPLRLLELVDKREYKQYPHCRHGVLGRLWRKINSGKGLYNTDAANKQNASDHELMETESQAYLYTELAKHKKRLKNISCDLTKQHDLLRLIIQKMEIHTEADDMDDVTEGDALMPKQSEVKAIGWSSPALRNSLLKQTSVLAALKKH